MPLSRGIGGSLALLAAVIAVVALLAPSPKSNSGSGDSTGCPLGYGKQDLTADLPAGHPPTKSASAVSKKTNKGKAVVFHNATIWTGAEKASRAEAMAVDTDGVIIAVGSNQEILQTFDSFLHARDMQGRYMCPGFIDPHLHLLQGGLLFSRLDLSNIITKADFIAAVKATAEDKKAHEWVLGGNWDEAKWGGVLPALDWVDVTQIPVLLQRMDGHMAVCNSAALRLAGITAESAAPPGGQIHRDSAGNPSGILTDAAIDLVASMVPAASLETRRRALQDASTYLLSKGVTSVHDMGRAPFNSDNTWDDLEDVYLPAAEAGQLAIRINAFTPLVHWTRLATKVRGSGWRHFGGRLSWGGLKEFADGSLGSRTALMREPYADDPTTSGLRVADLAGMEERVLKADKAGLQVAIHAIGDQAVEDIAELYSRVAAANGQRPRRHRIEHVQHLVGPQAAARLGQLGVLAVPNPLHLLADGPALEPRLGKERAGPGHAYAFRTLQQAGVRLAFGSDWPVVPEEPLLGIYASVHRKQPGTGEAWVPEEAIAAEDALRSHTAHPAYAGFADDMVGILREGMKADFVVLSGSPLLAEAESGVPTVLATYVDGKCAYGC